MMVEVDSDDVLAMRDETFAELLDEINAKRMQTSMAAVLGWSAAGVALLAALAAGGQALGLLLLAAPAWAIGRWLDSYRRTCVLFYDLDPDVERRYEEAVRCFDTMAACGGKWHVAAGGAV